MGFWDRVRVKSCIKKIKTIRFLGVGDKNMKVKRGKKVKHEGKEKQKIGQVLVRVRVRG